MKQDMELVRKILLEMRDGDRRLNGLRQRFGDDVVGHHCYLICKAGLAEGLGVDDQCLDPGSIPVCEIDCLTSAGHQFVEAILKDTTWEKTKAAAMKAAGDVSIEALKVAATLVVKAIATGGF